MVERAEKQQTLGGHRYPRDNQHYNSSFVGRKMRDGNENTVGLHAARGCRGAVQAFNSIYDSLTDVILVQEAKITQKLIHHRHPRENENYKTSFVVRKMREGIENIVGLHATRGCQKWAA